MFNSAKGSGYAGAPGQGATTIIARGVKVEGDFTSQGDVLIEGSVHGTFSTGGMLTVGTEAKIKADVNAGSALISGTIEGNVMIIKHADIKATAKISGDITAETITIESGAVLNGRMSVGSKATVAVESDVRASSRRERASATAVLS